MQKLTTSVAAFMLALFPAVAAAQNLATGEIGQFIGGVSTFINDILIPLVFAVALLMFLYGIANYFIIGGGDEGKRAEGKKLMLYSIVGFVLMVSIFGIVNLIVSGLGFDGKEQINNIPNAPTSNR
ncbi:hypothetical protein KC722_01470 [Candidatus Kaiserbacteria bacterium]|nr:hypothetical protein [Candidatus Kaiserbacteria bacterium]